MRVRGLMSEKAETKFHADVYIHLRVIMIKYWRLVVSSWMVEEVIQNYPSRRKLVYVYLNKTSVWCITKVWEEGGTELSSFKSTYSGTGLRVCYRQVSLSQFVFSKLGGREKFKFISSHLIFSAP